MGNCIKSKKMPTYIAEFIDKGVINLLVEDGHSFVNKYYETVEMIYNQEIPLSKIANKSRVRISVEDYKKKMKTKKFKPHMMYKGCKGKMAFKMEDHNKLKEKGYGHKKNCKK